MIDLKAISSPSQLRAAVREASYANSETERATIAAADAAANAVVARHTTLMQTEAVKQMDEGKLVLDAAAELANTLSTVVRTELALGVDPSQLSATYERLESGIRTKVAELRREADKADLLADRLDSPEDDYERLIARLPALRRGIQW